MGISMVSGVGYLSKGFNPFWAFKLISFSSTIAKIFMSSVSLIVFAVIGIILARKAKRYGLHPVIPILLCLFMHFVGVLISILLITIKKREMNEHERRMRMAPPPPPPPFGGFGFGNRRPFGFDRQNRCGQNNNGFWQQIFPGQGQAQAPEYNLHCPYCGNGQNDGVFCKICGSRLN